MKKIGLLLIFPAICFLFLNNKFVEDAHPNEMISKSYAEGVHEFVASINQFKKSTETFKGSKVEVKELQRLFTQSRHTYKSIECFSAYLDYYSTGLLNGPNLPKIEYEQNEPFSYKPATGLQVLEEALYEDEIPNKDTLLMILQDFETPLRTLKSQTLGFTFTDEMIFDAFRHQTLRIMALGVSGFDSPVALQSIPEAKASIMALQAYYTSYKSKIENQKPLTYQETNQLFENAVKYLNLSKDFNTFDRVAFIKNYLDPLFRAFQETAKILNIKPIDETFPNQTPLYSQAQSLFSKDLIKPYFFHKRQIEKPREGMVALGKLLFFDPILSENNKRACASCHNPQKAFTDGNTVSMGFDFKGKLQRNAPTLLNCGYQQKFQWDARAFHMEDQFAHVMFNKDEMGSNATLIQSKINQSEEYKALFRKAFDLGDKDEITHELVFSCIATYIRTLNTFEAHFDKYMRGELVSIDKDALRGFNLFMGKAKCGTCHFAPVFNGTIPPDYTNTESEVLGVTLNSDFKHPKLDQDPGRYVLASIEEHQHSFKTPTLRNIALTAPYMHNGAYKTLEEVMEFYNNGGGAGIGLEVPYQTLPSDKLNLSKKEIKEVISFMKSLTDTSGTTSVPYKLPKFEDEKINNRKIGGEY